MDVPEIAAVALTSEEQKLFDSVNFTEREPANMMPDDPDSMFEASAQLTRMLLGRKAIPEIRLRYFNDPDLNIGGHGKSREQVFTSNGCRGEEILRHPQFFKYLRYFVLGPDLPPSVKARFRQIIIDDRGTSGMVLDQLCSFARAQMRELKSPTSYDLPEEFFKLALECGVTDGVATSVRKAAKSAR